MSCQCSLDVGQNMFDLACLLLALLKSLTCFLLEQQAQTETLETYLVVSCADGKPTEEPPKGRGRGFGGMDSMTLEFMCTCVIYEAVSLAPSTIVLKLMFFSCLILPNEMKHIVSVKPSS